MEGAVRGGGDGFVVAAVREEGEYAGSDGGEYGEPVVELLLRDVGEAELIHVGGDGEVAGDGGFEAGVVGTAFRRAGVAGVEGITEPRVEGLAEGSEDPCGRGGTDGVEVLRRGTMRAAVSCGKAPREREVLER